jgi:hypothetical protein
MGQAKRKRDAAKTMPAPVHEPEFIDDRISGVSYELRDARLKPRRLLQEWLRVCGTETVRGTGEAEVPCQGCTACCCGACVNVDTTREPPERLEKMRLQQDEEGWHLPRREDGGCIHLGPRGCTIYADRPDICRVFDCRVTAMGLAMHPRAVVQLGRGAPVAVPIWTFSTDNPEDAALVVAARTLTLETAAKGVPLSPRGVLDGLTRVLPEARAAVAEACKAGRRLVPSASEQAAGRRL